MELEIIEQNGAIGKISICTNRLRACEVRHLH